MSVIIGRAPEVQQTDYIYYQDLQKPPIWESEGIKYIKLSSGTRYDNYYGERVLKRIYLTPIEEFQESFDVESFVEDFLMQPKRELLEAVESFNNVYSYKMNELELKQLGINRKFGWKPGGYDTIRRLILEFQGHYMKPQSMISFEKRMLDRRYSLDRLFSSLRKIERLKDIAKSYCFDSTIDIDEGIEIFNQALQVQQEQTTLANNAFNNMYIQQFIGNKSDQLHRTSIFTYIEMEPYEMVMQDGDYNDLAKAKINKTYLLFEMNLMDVLDKHKNPNTNVHIQEKYGAYPSVIYRHPYINNGGLYTYNEQDRANYYYKDAIKQTPWGSLCLSDYDSEIRDALTNNDFILLLSTISMWSQIFNTHRTNPYNSSSRFMTDLSDSKELSKIGFNTNNCWDDTVHTLKYTLLKNNSNIEAYRQYMIDEIDVYQDMNYYHKSIKSICDEKQCNYRGNCMNYNRFSPDWENDLAEENEDYLEILHQLFAQYWRGFNMDDINEWDWWNLINDKWGCDMNGIETSYQISNETQFPELYHTEVEMVVETAEETLTEEQREELMSSMQHWQYSNH
tara:strand:- start:4558 stop:6255 length:1698 start_codon:yes stop_codon:yes gene_type:complete